MTSSMLAGERRWASARRGGMTVLGKVAVPKPINLPSQKLENHGLDPNVEIVPKGSLSWGSRPSSSTSNPWASSAGSPSADGTNVSPHHPSGRPSSGGGLSRPSTAGSDRHELSATTRGPNSRPSSASGVLTSNQSSLTSSRPLSAETRPGSSHLSRFAEPTFDNSMAWGPNGSADKMSIPSKANDFSLSSGDFPTLGSEKDNTAKSSEAHDHDSHVRPGSGSGRTAHSMDRNEMIHADHKSGTVDTWARDHSPHFEDGVRSGVGKWQGDPQQYINPNVPPQHFDAWRGPPMNAPPAGVWYRGPPPSGPPYPPVPHSGYPMEHFPYYHPQIPPNLANPQSGPPPGSGPRGHHPRNGDFYRPQMADAFMRPGMPIRPGFYPGPVPYDGYYGPPMGYNPNDRDIPFMGMPSGPHGPHGLHGPPVFNMGPPQKGPPQNPPELNDTHFRGSGGVSGGNMFASEQLNSISPEESRGPYKVLRKPDHERHADIDEDNWEQNLDKSDQPRPSFHKNERGVDTRRNEDMSSRRHVGNQGHPSASVFVHSQEGSSHKSRPFNESLGNKSSLPEVRQDIPDNTNDPSLIQKIEGLHTKVWASDGSGVVKEEHKNRLLVNPNHKDKSTTIAFGTISDIGDLDNSKSTTASASLYSRQIHHGVRSQPDHHSKGKLNNQDTDGWRKKPSALGSDVENLEIKSTGESLTLMADPMDGQAQRARMRELAKQRAVQLQREEEERIREQKAKALAKLEELNRRTLAAGDGITQTAEKTLNTDHEQEDVDGFQKSSEPTSDDNKHEEPVVQINENSQQEPVDQPLVSKQIVANTTDVEIKAAPLGDDGNLNKQKHEGHRQKQCVQMVESSAEKPTPNAVIKNSVTNVSVSDEGVPSQQPSLSNISNVSFDLTQQRKRNNKSGKNKHKLDEASALIEGDDAKPESPQFASNLNVLATDGKDAMQSNLEQTSLPSNQFKPQHPRRMPRNPQANRIADRFHVGDVAVWVPVRAQDKEERVDEYSQRTQKDDVALPAKTINSGQTNSKNKRAEMERYVPKPVAKELAQQGTGNQSATSSPEKTALEDTTDREDLGSQPAIPVSVSMGSTVEAKVNDNKHNKQAKSHGAWKQRGPTDLNCDQGFQQDSKKNNQKFTSYQHEHANPVSTDLNRDQGFQQDTKRSYQKSMSQHEPANPVSAQQDTKKSYQKSINQHEPVNIIPTETNVTHEWDPSDGWFMPDEVPPVISAVKDEGGITGKGKKPTYKGQRNTLKNHNVDYKDISGAGVEIEQTERPVSSNENLSSQWQPKSQSYKGNWSGGQNANPPVKPEEPNVEYKNIRRVPHERKAASFRVQNDSSNQGFGNMEDEGPGFRKYGGHNNRPGGQDNRRQHNQHIASENRERRQNVHYEYQPVGSSNNNNNDSNKSSNHDAPAAADGSGNAGPRYKERGSGQSRRGGGGSGGNFYGRQ